MAWVKFDALLQRFPLPTPRIILVRPVPAH
jgi:hypothetical protein